ncbi:MAG: hypothetical protein A2261_03740 [Candidatus Magasanikbacteria bacterium RIFOXYA2_FULL_44_8]|uniref:Bacterial type II secretion system protein E domain-containing protein n=1 Tax=Candidatus Magasanikbacteria bacterium RIFOXYA2_FULL_44_8 TaxID=1798696 RepID=A0A1F6NL34_9BACT|nr:MAG: hypothetical protein A2261_03740 [Candidatus Magasanikbacteria bacterium RIFOXYA2_FULL_44_8]
MALDDKKIVEILLAEQYLDEDALKIARKEIADSRMSLVDYLLSENVVSKDLLGQAVAEHYGIRYADLSKEKITEDIVNFIPEVVARARGVIVFGRDVNGVKVAFSDPGDVEIEQFVEKRIGEKIIQYYALPQDFESAFGVYKMGLHDSFAGIIDVLKNTNIQNDRDQAIVDVVDTLLQYAYQNKASDIHIEPYAKKIVVRFRIDGVLHDVLDLPLNLAEYVLTRIKVLSKMRTDEHRAAQDGKLRFTIEGENVDVRVSILPVTKGEKVVMRLLSSKNREFGLVDLGLGEADLQKVKKAIDNPHGMILVTGPTGSGKTTTLYAVLKILNKRDVNIATIEDPVEYDIEGVSQIQVNVKSDLTFAKGLRAIVRQDPDIIMVGEIRDEETADIAVNSALTGHLVLSTIHTNDAATTLPRLIDMNVQPFLVASTINVAIAQRLVRKICTKCRASYTIGADEKAILENYPQIKKILEKRGYKKFDKLTLYRGAGCQVCGQTGYTGRFGIFEVLEMTSAVKELILKNASSDAVNALAKEQGMTDMLEDGIGKALNGQTTLGEVLRATH